MKAGMLGAMVLNEIRIRTRRLSTLVAVLAVIAITWMIVADPAGGRAMIVIDRARAIYNSTALALGTSVLASFLMGLGAFYLVRGRTREDLIHGMGGVLAATPIGNAALIFARWLGAVAYLVTLILAVMATMLVLQAVRGEAPLEPLVFLQTYALMLMPTILLAASVAVLCDSFSPLMGKGGDVVYFVLWIAQFSALPQAMEKKLQTLGPLAALDISGLAVTAFRVKNLFGNTNFSLGGSSFDPSRPLVVLDHFWTEDMIEVRLLCILIAMLPLLPAFVLFHRFSPDRVKVVVGNRRSLWAWINHLLRPVTFGVRPLLTLSARLPGLLGQTTADTAVTLMGNPVAVVAMLLIIGAGLIADEPRLGGVTVAAFVCWGILISDLAVRDYQAATEPLTAAAPGGAVRRYARHLFVALLLGLLCAAPVLARWVVNYPLGAAAIVTGLFVLAGIASLLGRLTRTGRTFLALFLFALYMAVQIKDVPWLDAVGIHHAATAESVSTQFAVGVAVFALGYFYNRLRAA